MPIVCCCEKMQELVSGTTDAVIEKHVPVYEVRNGKVLVSVGSVVHPMTGDHYIESIDGRHTEKIALIGSLYRNRKKKIYKK